MRSIFDDTEDLTWQEYGDCVGHPNPDLFFPTGAPSAEVKEICRGCPVHDECLEYALEHNEKFGVWGGTSERERRRLRRQRLARRAAERAAQAPQGAS